MTGGVLGAHKEVGLQSRSSTATVVAAEKAETSFQSHMPDPKLAVLIHRQQKAGTSNAWQVVEFSLILLRIFGVSLCKSWCP